MPRVEHERDTQIREPPAHGCGVVATNPQVDDRCRKGWMLRKIEGIPQFAGGEYTSARSAKLIFEFDCNGWLFLDNEDGAPRERETIHEVLRY
jgi:hypothetical protein